MWCGQDGPCRAGRSHIFQNPYMVIIHYHPRGSGGSVGSGGICCITPSPIIITYCIILESNRHMDTGTQGHRDTGSAVRTEHHEDGMPG